MFTVKKAELDRLLEKLVDDLGENLSGELKTELRIMGYEEGTLRHIVYDKPAKLVGSKDWGVAVLDAGRVAGEWPPFNKIMDWVIQVKEAGKHLSEKEYMDITWAIARKIKEEGIAPKWFARRVLQRFHL